MPRGSCSNVSVELLSLWGLCVWHSRPLQRRANLSKFEKHTGSSAHVEIERPVPRAPILRIIYRVVDKHLPQECYRIGKRLSLFCLPVRKKRRPPQGETCRHEVLRLRIISSALQFICVI